MVPLLPLRDGVRALPISFFRQSMPSFYMNAPDCICSPGRLPLGAFCAGRDDLEREALHDDRISIRAPRAGCDHYTLHVHLGFGIFQSTRPVWGATGHDPRKGAGGSISIHAPRVGRDQRYKRGHFAGQISIHAPRVGRDLTRRSPPPAPSRISIHAPRVGRDHSLLTVYRAAGEFQSTRPVGARQDLPAVLKPVAAISIHAPHGRGGVSAGRPAGRCSHRP